MTNKPKDQRTQLHRISTLYIEDLLNTSDTDILAESNERFPAQKPGDAAKAAYQRALKIVGQKRLQAARDAMKREADDADLLGGDVDIQKARSYLEKLVGNDPVFGREITLAARNLQDIPDSEVLEIINNLRRLGACSIDDLT